MQRSTASRRSGVPRLPDFDRNGRIVVAARALRSFAFGLTSIALGLYLAELGLSGEQIGLVLSAAFVGSLFRTVVVAGWGDRIGRRRFLMAGSALMVTAALIPLVSREPVLLAVVALLGVIAVNANESTELQTVDQALLPQSVPDSERTAAFALYNLIAAAASAVGALAVGLLPLVGLAIGLTGADVYAPAFMVYALIGAAALVLHSRLDARAESGERLEGRLAIGRSRPIVARLSILFSLDSFASSLSVHSFIAFFLASRFDLEPAVVAGLFFAAGVLTTISFPAAAWLANRIGLINTMVFTHIPSSVFLIGLAVAPDAVTASICLLGRYALAQMDVPARQSYTMAVVEPRERTATAGVTSLAKSIAQAPGPALAGALLVPLGLGVPLVVTGVLKITYDVLLYAMFRSTAERIEDARRPSAD